MSTCPICETENVSFRQKSHVIPRFLVKQTKRDGLNVYIGNERVRERNFSDIKAKIVCDVCELKFKRDDDFAKKFFDENKFYQKGHTFQPKDPRLKIAGYDEYKPEAFAPLKKFIYSVLLRHHLYLLKVESRNLLGQHFDEIKQRYTSNNIRSDEYPTCMIRYVDFSTIGYPTRERSGGLNSVFMIIKNYRIWTYIDSRHHMEKSFADFNMSEKHLRSLMLSFQNTKFQKDLLKTVNRHIS